MMVRRIKIWKRRGQYHIDTRKETAPWCYVFLLSSIHRLSVCKEDFSLRSK